MHFTAWRAPTSNIKIRLQPHGQHIETWPMEWQCQCPSCQAGWPWAGGGRGAWLVEGVANSIRGICVIIPCGHRMTVTSAIQSWSRYTSWTLCTANERPIVKCVKIAEEFVHCVIIRDDYRVAASRVIGWDDWQDIDLLVFTWEVPQFEMKQLCKVQSHNPGEHGR